MNRGARTDWIVAAASAAALISSLFGAPHASATTAWSDPQVLSGPTLLPPDGAPGSCGSPTGDQDWEKNPTIAVDPTNRANLAVAWVQDWDDAVEVAYSHDGGQHWSKVVPPTTPCTGGPTTFGSAPGVVSAIDPVIGFGLDASGTHGVAYLAWIAQNTNPKCPDGAMVNRSLDGGRTWSQPVMVDETPCDVAGQPNQAIDGMSLSTDPRRPGHAYITYGKLQAATFAPWEQYTATTSDAGAHWSNPPAEVPSDVTENAGTIQVLPDGSLVDLMESVPPQATREAGATTTYGPYSLYVSRWDDQTRTWSKAAHATDLGTTDQAFFISSAVGPTGVLYVAWVSEDQTTPGYELKLISSTDGGGAWSAPEVVAQHGGAGVRGTDLVAAPAIAVNHNGTIALGFYDHREDPTGTSGKTDYWVDRSIAGGGWAEDRVAGPFNERAATGTDAKTFHTLGDYEGLVPQGGGFVAAFALSAPMGGATFAMATPAHNTDIFFSRVIG